MPPLTIVEDLDVLEDVAPGLIAGLIVTMMDQFSLQAVEEALHGGVVPAVAFAAHRTHHAVLDQLLLIVTGSVLAATVGMMHAARQRPASLDRHVEGGQ